MASFTIQRRLKSEASTELSFSNKPAKIEKDCCNTRPARHLISEKGKLPCPGLHPSACVKYSVAHGSWDYILLLCPWGFESMMHYTFQGRKSLTFRLSHIGGKGCRGRNPTCNFSCWSHSLYIGWLNVNCSEDKYYSLDAPLSKVTPVFASCLTWRAVQQGQESRSLSHSPLLLRWVPSHWDDTPCLQPKRHAATQCGVKQIQGDNGGELQPAVPYNLLLEHSALQPSAWAERKW